MFGTDEELLSEEKQKLESNHANIKNKDERRIALGIELVEKFGFSYRDASSLLKNKINYGTLRYRHMKGNIVRGNILTQQQEEHILFHILLLNF